MTDAVLTVVGGRMVLTKGEKNFNKKVTTWNLDSCFLVSSPMSSGVSYPVNGQQLMMQLDSLTSSLMDMAVTTDEGNMETEQSQQQQHILTQQQIIQTQQQQQ